MATCTILVKNSIMQFFLLHSPSLPCGVVCRRQTWGCPSWCCCHIINWIYYKPGYVSRTQT